LPQFAEKTVARQSDDSELRESKPFARDWANDLEAFVNNQ
jgi:hypothetical protein